MLEVKLPLEMGTRFRTLCSQAETLLAPESNPIDVRLEDLNLKFDLIEPLPPMSPADQGPCPQIIETHDDARTRQRMEVGKYDETNHLPTVNRPPMEIAPN